MVCQDIVYDSVRFRTYKEQKRKAKNVIITLSPWLRPNENCYSGEGGFYWDIHGKSIKFSVLGVNQRGTVA